MRAMRRFKRQTKASLAQSYRGARSLEAVENYSRSGRMYQAIADMDTPWDGMFVYDDELFWTTVLADSQKAWGKSFELYRVALSTWVARVPGLFWTEGAGALREIVPDVIEEYTSHNWVVLRPHGKSRQVLGGIGTLKFPEDEHGWRLVTLSFGHNASSGIPALIEPNVWEYHNLDDGSILNLEATWRSMPEAWAERFPSIKGIPRGALVVSNPMQVTDVKNIKAPTEFHPCTVMEYYDNDAKLYDFVYATVDTGVRNYRRQLEAFFNNYKKAQGRCGKYLISADIADPLWEAEYNSPDALHRAEPGAKSQLELLQARVRDTIFKGHHLDEIVQFLARKYDNDGLRRISQIIGVPPAHWFKGSASADSTVQLLHLCLDRGKVEELVDAVAREYPQAFL